MLQRPSVAPATVEATAPWSAAPAGDEEQLVAEAEERLADELTQVREAGQDLVPIGKLAAQEDAVDNDAGAEEGDEDIDHGQEDMASESEGFDDEVL
eukprot:SM000206S06260  [mRNA]  locus=s206:183976:184350:+ [translate_table: standard]